MSLQNTPNLMDQRLVKETIEFVRNKLQNAKWYFAVSYRGQIVWSNDEKRVWCQVLNNYKFETSYKWNNMRGEFEINLKAEKEASIDTLEIVIKDKKGILYLKQFRLGTIYLAKGNELTLVWKIELKEV